MGSLNHQRFQRHSTAGWALENPVLLDGEPGWDSTLKALKIGDGESVWTDLDFITDPGAGSEVVDATTTEKGIIQLATPEETAAMTASDRAVTPIGLASLDFGGGGGGGAGSILVWRYSGGAYDALPGTVPDPAPDLVLAIGPTDPVTLPSWIGTDPGDVPYIYVYVALT